MAASPKIDDPVPSFIPLSLGFDLRFLQSELRPDAAGDQHVTTAVIRLIGLIIERISFRLVIFEQSDEPSPSIAAVPHDGAV
jgi:hypothetical protein